MRNVSDKSCRENQNIFIFNIFFPENHAVYEIMWKNIVEPDRPQMTIWRMRIACWIPKATDTQPEHVVLIAFFTATMVARTRLDVTLYYVACVV
jgi:hypothetical protein